MADLRVGLDVTLLGEPVTGIGRYVDGLLRGLGDGPVELSPYAFLGRSREEKEKTIRSRLPQGLPLRVVPVPARFASIYTALPWSQSTFSDMDLLHLPIHTWVRASGCRRVVSVHDLTAIAHPHWYPPAVGRSAWRFLRRAVDSACHFVCISEATVRDFLEHFEVSPDRVHHTPLGWEAMSSDGENMDQEEASPPYFLMVGTISPRKNMARAVRAYGLFRKQGFPHRLVICGRDGWLMEEFREALAQSPFRDDVVRVFVPDDGELKKLYRSAAALFFPSLYEGFGFPILEAFAQGCPVITSRGSATEEVAGGAALLVDPLDEEGMAVAMCNLVEDPALAVRLRGEGRSRLAAYSWKECAAATLRAYRSAIEDIPSPSPLPSGERKKVRGQV
jgi:glycosyltransferase involved in cell wall biosynthesis